jgi:hypothetical protein
MSTTITTSIDIRQTMYGQDNTLASVEAMAGGRLRLHYNDGAEYLLDLSPLISRGGVMDKLADPDAFSLVRLASSGRAIEFSAASISRRFLRVDSESKGGPP